MKQGEHGIGLGKKESLMKELGADTIDVMRSVKKALDPYWLMNPGKIFEAVHVDSPNNHPKAASSPTLEHPEKKK